MFISLISLVITHPIVMLTTHFVINSHVHTSKLGLLQKTTIAFVVDNAIRNPSGVFNGALDAGGRMFTSTADLARAFLGRPPDVPNVAPFIRQHLVLAYDENVTEARFQVANQEFIDKLNGVVNKNKAGAMVVALLAMAAVVYQGRKVAISSYDLKVVTDQMQQVSHECSYFKEVATAQGQRVVLFQEELAKNIAQKMALQRVVVYAAVALVGSSVVVAIIVLAYHSVQGRIKAAEERGKKKGEEVVAKKAEEIAVERKQLRSLEQDSRGPEN